MSNSASGTDLLSRLARCVPKPTLPLSQILLIQITCLSLSIEGAYIHTIKLFGTNACYRGQSENSDELLDKSRSVSLDNSPAEVEFTQAGGLSKERKILDLPPAASQCTEKIIIAARERTRTSAVQFQLHFDSCTDFSPIA